MLKGSCLCGGVEFEFKKDLGPFELCHCSKCRKVSGSAFLPSVTVSKQGFRFVKGTELIKLYNAPILQAPPAYRSSFCKVCGSPVPDPTDNSDELEIPAGTISGELESSPDKHIYVDSKASWFNIEQKLPQFTSSEIKEHRLKK